MQSLLEFLPIAVLVTIAPGPSTATIIQVAARDGRRAAMSAVLGNSGGVLVWALLSAAGVSSLIIAWQIAYDALRLGGAAILIVLGLRSLLRRGKGTPSHPVEPRRRRGWRAGLATSLANPKLAVFFVALFPQFISREAAVLPLAVAMAATIVALDIIWFATLIYAVDRARTMMRPRVQLFFERVTGTVLIGLGIRLATEPR